MEHSSLTSVYGYSKNPLSELNSENDIPYLLKIAEDANSKMRFLAVNALGRIGSDVALPSLLKLVEDTDHWMRGYAVDALGRIGSDVALPSLIKLVEDEALNASVVKLTREDDSLD